MVVLNGVVLVGLDSCSIELVLLWMVCLMGLCGVSVGLRRLRKMNVVMMRMLVNVRWLCCRNVNWLWSVFVIFLMCFFSLVLGFVLVFMWYYFCWLRWLG